MKIIRITATLLLVLWMSVIFTFSSQNADESSGISGRVISFVISIFDGDFKELTFEEQAERIAPFQFLVRKTAHFTIYGILGVFSFFTYITYNKIPFKIRLFLSLSTCLLYSISDEIHQTFIPGRSGEIRDVCIDFCGSLLFIAVLTLLFQSRKLKKYI